MNPGSLGQPKQARPEACYALWEKGGFALRSVSYDVEATVAKVEKLPLTPEVGADLIAVLRNGCAAPQAGV